MVYIMMNIFMNLFINGGRNMTDIEILENLIKEYEDEIVLYKNDLNNNSERLSIDNCSADVFYKNILDSISNVERCIEVFKNSIEALKKQIPEKPYIWGDGCADGADVYDMWDCPGCSETYEIDGEKYDFCPKCGQALDWGEE